MNIQVIRNKVAWSPKLTFKYIHIYLERERERVRMKKREGEDKGGKKKRKGWNESGDKPNMSPKR